MKRIKNVSTDDRFTMFTLVNQAPDPRAGVTPVIGKARDTLWDKLAGKLFDLGAATNEVDFTPLDGQDLMLNNTEFDVLLGCLEDGPHRDMFQRKACHHLKNKINNEAEECTDSISEPNKE